MPNRLSAGTHWLNRVEGQPVARAIVASDPIAAMTREERDEELERQRALVAQYEALQEGEP